MSGDIVTRTADAITAEIRRSPHAGRPAKTVFFGGGTPTFLPTDHLVAILKAVFEVHPPLPNCEITSESNPGTADAEKYLAMRNAGFNRLSLGAQSFRSNDLVRLGRVHSSTEIGNAVAMARRAGFENVNIDLMFALPGQSVRAWQQNLELAFNLKVDHLSLYCLTIEENTRFYKLHLKGMLDLPDESDQVAMYEQAVSMAAAHGLRQYEISNFARPGMECQHNIAYWKADEYAGYGPGAVGRIGGERRTVLKHPERYCNAIEQNQSVHFDIEPVDESTIMLERLMLGLRLNAGVRIDAVKLDQQGLAKCLERGWVDISDERIFLTDRGRILCNLVTAELAC